MHKKFVGDTVRTADPNQPKGYTRPSDIMFSDKSWGKKKERMTFGVTALSFQITITHDEDLLSWRCLNTYLLMGSSE